LTGKDGRQVPMFHNNPNIDNTRFPLIFKQGQTTFDYENMPKHPKLTIKNNVIQPAVTINEQFLSDDDTADACDERIDGEKIVLTTFKVISL